MLLPLGDERLMEADATDTGDIAAGGERASGSTTSDTVAAAVGVFFGAFFVRAGMICCNVICDI